MTDSAKETKHKKAGRSGWSKFENKKAGGWGGG